MKYFWTNTVWFVLLGLTTIVELIIIFSKARNRKFNLAFYITLTGIALAVEVKLFYPHGTMTNWQETFFHNFQ